VGRAMARLRHLSSVTKRQKARQTSWGAGTFNQYQHVTCPTEVIMKKLLALAIVVGSLGGCAVYAPPARLVVAPAPVVVYHPYYYHY
jgi:hypothetical protein